MDRTRYCCSAYRYRAHSVCNNTIMASRKPIETTRSRLYYENLLTPEGFAVYKEAAPTYAAARASSRPEENRLRRELAGEEQVIGNIMKAIEAGILTPTIKVRLEKASEATIDSTDGSKGRRPSLTWPCSCPTGGVMAQLTSPE